jgi:hypothetical protein
VFTGSLDTCTVRRGNYIFICQIWQLLTTILTKLSWTERAEIEIGAETAILNFLIPPRSILKAYKLVR